MWDRLRHKGGLSPVLNKKKQEAAQSQDSQSSSSSLSPAAGIKGGNGQYQYSVRGGNTSRRASKDVNQQRPETAQTQKSSGSMTAPPVNARPNTALALHPDSHNDRPSTGYSQPSTPEVAVFPVPHLEVDVAHPSLLDISPPSSAGLDSWEGLDGGDVSPIDESPDSLQFDKTRRASTRTEGRSNIPIIRRDQRQNSDAGPSTKSHDQTSSSRPYTDDIRWDPLTGETTSSLKGRPSQVKPREFANDLANRAVSASFAENRSFQSSQPNPASYVERLRKVRQSSTGAQPEQGASGRTVPLTINPKNGKGAHRTPQARSSIESNGSEAASSPSQVETQGVSPVSDSDSSQIRPLTASFPAPPSSESAGRGSHLPPLQLTPNDKAIRRKPAREGSGQYPEPSTPATLGFNTLSDGDVQLSPTTPQPMTPALTVSMVDRGRPVVDYEMSPSIASSRPTTPGPVSPSFSILDRGRPIVDYERSPSIASSRPTTPTPISPSAPTFSILDRGRPIIGYEKSPGITSPQPEPTPTPTTPTPKPRPTTAVSMLERGRPIIQGYEKSLSPVAPEPVKISLESSYFLAPPSATSAKPRVASKENGSANGADSGAGLDDKVLPPVPPEVLAKDRIAELNAQLEALGNRRININMAIKKITENMPVEHLLASESVVRKREEEKRKIETFRTELEDIERQSYEIGLRLHLAYKRLDGNARYEPTTLWVRRFADSA